MKKVSILILISFSLLSADIIHVPADQPTIQEGINVAANGDTVLVANGVYTEAMNKNLTWNGNEKHITLKSENGFENCIIDCENSGRAFCFNQTSQDSTDIIDGFTLMNGLLYFNDPNGASFYCHSVSPQIINNKLINNSSDGKGGGLYVKLGNPIIKYNIFESNFAEIGGGIYLTNSDAIIEQNIISQNTVTPIIYPGSAEGGGIYISSGSPRIINNIIIDNTASTNYIETSATAGGIYVFNSNAVIQNNLISDNCAFSISSYTTGGVETFIYSDSDVCTGIINNTISDNNGGGIFSIHGAKIKNNIISNNSTHGLAVYYPQSNNGIVLNNNVSGNNINFGNCPPGIGNTTWGVNINGTACDSCFNISEDPLFISDAQGDYFLSQIASGQTSQSTCVDAGNGFPDDYGLEEFTTRTDLEWDTSFIDIGYHYPGIELVSVHQNTIPNFSLQTPHLSNFPNPFNPSTTINFSVTQTSSFATIEIYNLKGQKVRTLPVILSDAQHFIEGSGTTNKYPVIWNGTDNNNKPVSSGIYFVKLKAGNQVATRKMILMK